MRERLRFLFRHLLSQKCVCKGCLGAMLVAASFLCQTIQPFPALLKPNAGSGIVHMVGGACALSAAYFIGPRHGRFDRKGKPVNLPGHSSVLSTLGAMILWFSWYGFNSCSTLVMVGVMGIAIRAAVNTTVAAAAGGIMALTVHRLVYKNHIDLPPVLNGILAGLVSISGPCALVTPAESMVIAALGAIFYYHWTLLLLRFQIDDPLEASSVHFCCGAWGALSIGLFAKKAYVAEVYAIEPASWGLLRGGGGS